VVKRLPRVCPLNVSGKTCEIVQRSGSVRDFPDVKILECLNCGVTFHESDLSHKVNYPAGTMNAWQPAKYISTPVPDEDDKRRGDFFRRLFPRNRSEIQVLDFGSGKGNLLFELKDEFDVEGIEIDLEARISSQKLGFTVYESLDHLEKLGKKFDVISLIHVIEHIYQPIEILKRLSNLLKQSGSLIIETPNADDALLTKYECKEFQNWTYWSHHPILYNYIGMHNLLQAANLKIISNESVQRYNLANHMYWLSNGKPGGHTFWKATFPGEINELYKSALFDENSNDTIFVRVSK